MNAVSCSEASWDAQLGLWTPKAVQDGLNTRQIDENVVFKLADQRPDLLTGGNPATGQPQPYGSAGVDINCAPTANLAPPAPNSQFPPGSWQAAAGTLCPGRRTARHLKHPAGPPGRPAGHA